MTNPNSCRGATSITRHRLGSFSSDSSDGELTHQFTPDHSRFVNTSAISKRSTTSAIEYRCHSKRRYDINSKKATSTNSLHGRSKDLT